MSDTILRGGRLTKYKGEAASFAPGSGVAASGSVLERATAMLGSSVSMPAFGARSLAAALAIAVPLALAGPAHAQVIPPAAPCDVVSDGGTTITCTGDVGAGVLLTNGGGIITTLNVNTLTQDIAPAAGVDGINFTSDGDITITSDTGLFAITTTGNNAEGIYANSTNGNVTVTQTGNITTNGIGAEGIYAEANGGGNVTVTQTGNITTNGNDAYGINAETDGGGNVTVTQTGNITILGDGYGIYADADGGGNVTVTQTGNISTQNSDGIDAQSYDGGDVTVTQTGTITTVGNNNIGIDADTGDGGNVTVIQTGTITTQGAGADGIGAEADDGGNVTVIQTGTITTMGVNARGIEANADDGGGSVTVTQTGTITTQGAGAEGIFAEIDNGAGSITITTNSTITAAAAAGIQVDNDGTGATTITTAGAVSGTTGIDILVRNNNAPTTINNSAAITGTGGVAINFQGEGNDTLNILPGSVINGTIDFGNGNANDVDTLNVGPGINAVFTFADASGGDSALLSAPENITGNVALINGGTQAVAVDVTGFAAAGAAVGGLTTGIFNTIENSIGAAQGGLPLTGGISPAGGNTKAYGSNRRLWVSGFGGKQKIDGSSNQAGIKGNFGGLITGVETSLDARNSYGVFGGFARSRIDLEFNAGDVETDSVFGGAYWKMDYGTFRVQLAVVAGSADQDTTRNVGGVNARGEADGWFFSPSLTLAAPIEGLSVPLIISGRVSYAGLFLDGYTETGVANPLTVGDRDVSVFSTRAQLTLPQVIANKDGSTIQIDWRTGVDAQFDAGSDDVSLTVGGTPLSFSADLDNQVAGFIGSTVTYTSENGLYNLSASGEIQSTFDGGYKAIGQLRAAVNF